MNSTHAYRSKTHLNSYSYAWTILIRPAPAHDNK